MSGGHYNYSYSNLIYLAESIKEDFAPVENNQKCEHLAECSPVERSLIIMEVKNLIKTLKHTANRAKALEWFLSGDFEAMTYLEEVGIVKKQ